MNEYNAAHRPDVKAAAKLAKLADLQRQEVISSLMSTVPGRQWMLERLERTHVFSVSFNGDSLRSAFAEGERNVGLQDLNDIMRFCPDKYLLMMQERNQRDLSHAGSTAAERSSSPNGDGGVEGPVPDANAGFDDEDGRYHN